MPEVSEILDPSVPLAPIDFAGGLREGYQLLEYRVERVLGHGGFGITYLARDTHLDKPVAIKEYLPSDLAVRLGDTTVTVKSADTHEAFAWGRASFLKEAQTLARFSHPHLVHIYRFFEAHGTAYFVMEYAEGTSFGARLKLQGTVEEAEIRAVLLPVMEGLAVVHEAGILHRDIKPENIMLKADGQPVLIDFGAARQSLSTVSKSLMTVATAGYAPLEQYSTGLQQGPWTDLYALGAVAYRAVTGRKPPDAIDRVKNDPYVAASLIGFGKYSTSFLTAIDWALAVDAEDRPQTIAQWRDALDGKVVPKVTFNTGIHKPQAPPPRDPGLERTEITRSDGRTAPISVASIAVPAGRLGWQHLARRYWQLLRRDRRLALGAGAGAALLVSGLLIWLARPSGGPPPATVAVPLKAESPAPGARETRVQAQLAFMQAQVDYAQRRYPQALARYDEALKLNPELERDPAAAVQLVGLLTRDYGAVAPLIRRHHGKVVVAELAARSGDGGPVGRKAAQRMLQELGLARRIDWTGDAMAQFKEGESCEDRLKAVKRLAQLKDKRALPVLKEAVTSNPFKSTFGRNACLQADASKLIKQLEKK